MPRSPQCPLNQKQNAVRPRRSAPRCSSEKGPLGQPGDVAVALRHGASVRYSEGGPRGGSISGTVMLELCGADGVSLGRIGISKPLLRQ
jgi:hypothetical protein